jgi:hypothetical protein
MNGPAIGSAAAQPSAARDRHLMTSKIPGKLCVLDVPYKETNPVEAVSFKIRIFLCTATCRGEQMTDYRVAPGEAQEDQITASIEKYTSQVPSSVYLGLAIASIAASLSFKIAKKDHAALYVGHWVAPFLLLGIYNKLVKQHGSDAAVQH